MKKACFGSRIGVSLRTSLKMLMKPATKIIGTLTNIPNFMVSYDDMEFVLDVVASAIKRARDLNVQTERSEKE